MILIRENPILRWTIGIKIYSQVETGTQWSVNLAFRGCHVPGPVWEGCRVSSSLLCSVSGACWPALVGLSWCLVALGPVPGFQVISLCLVRFLFPPGTEQRRLFRHSYLYAVCIRSSNGLAVHTLRVLLSPHAFGGLGPIMSLGTAIHTNIRPFLWFLRYRTFRLALVYLSPINSMWPAYSRWLLHLRVNVTLPP